MCYVSCEGLVRSDVEDGGFSGICRRSEVLAN